MSVPGLMYFYGGALVGAGFLGLDKGVPVAGPAPLVPLATGLGATMLLFGYLSTPSGPQPPKKGEPGFGLCVSSSCCVYACSLSSRNAGTWRLCTLACSCRSLSLVRAARAFARQCMP